MPAVKCLNATFTSIMQPLGPWQLFRPLAIACLAAILMLTVLWLCLKTSYYSPFHQPFDVWWAYLLNDSIFGILSFGWVVLPPAVLLLFAFFIGTHFHLVQYAITRYGYRRVGTAAYVFMVLEFFLLRVALFGHSPHPVIVVLNFLFSLFPGLLLLAWRGLRRVTTRQRAYGKWER